MIQDLSIHWYIYRLRWLAFKNIITLFSPSLIISSRLLFFSSMRMCSWNLEFFMMGYVYLKSKNCVQTMRTDKKKPKAWCCSVTQTRKSFYIRLLCPFGPLVCYHLRSCNRIFLFSFWSKWYKKEKKTWSKKPPH